MSFKKQLMDMDACDEAIAWVGDRTLTEAWALCPRGDWMLWWLGMMAGDPMWPTHQEVVRHTCVVVRKAVEFIPEITGNKVLFSKAIETTELWASNMTDIESVENALHDIRMVVYTGLFAADMAMHAIYSVTKAAIAPANDRLKRANCVCVAAKCVAVIAENKKDELKAQADYLRAEVSIPEVSS
jgi:hypothetical protein